MSTTIWGLLQLSDAYTPVQTAGQTQSYAAIQEFTRRHNAGIQRAISTLVGATTTAIESFFETPGGGMMQESNRLTRPGAIKAYGRYNVAYPLRDARDQLAGDDITLAYLTLEQLQRSIETVFVRHVNWVRFNILKALFNNANDTLWYEEAYDRTLTIRRLANTDGTTYAPIINADTGSDDNHYLVSNYTSANISNTNNPFVTLRDEIKEHFGEDVNIVVFINPAQTAIVKTLAAFVEYGDPMLTTPLDATVIRGSAPQNVPGMIIGRISNVWVSEWNSVPADYMLAVDVSQPGPLTKRIDAQPVQGRGELALIARQVEFPLEESFWRDRHGYGVSNRLSAAIMQFKASGTYDIPATFV